MVANSKVGGLYASVLVLNRYYMAVHVITVRRAFSLLFRDLAEVIHLEEGVHGNYDFRSWCEMSELWADFKRPHDDWVRSVKLEIQAPRVIRLYRYDRPPRQRLRFSRRSVLVRDGHCCQYCGNHYPSTQLSLDHVIPRSRGGENTWENIVCACLGCNVKKGGRTPQEARMSLIRAPVRPKVSPLLAAKLQNPKYHCWQTFVGRAAAAMPEFV